MSRKPTHYPSLPVLIVDDEAQALNSYDTALRYGGLDNIITCQDSRMVLDLLERQEAEVLVLDLLMPHITGEELLGRIRSDFPQIPVVVVTGVDDVETAVRCMKTGAFDYLVKPIDNDRLVTTVGRAIAFQELERENKSLKRGLLSKELKHARAFSEIITDSERMKAIFLYVEAIAATQKPVLITGETGVGKELIARALHGISGRTGPFVAANVGGLDDNLFSDTLFGHARGAFTGADHQRGGLIEKASGGTLLLDEIGDLSPMSQIKLLRLLQEDEYLPLGEDVPKKGGARVVATTNQDIQALVESGRFRKDLYYRLRTHHIAIPPLRERRGDLPMLLDRFLEQAALALSKKKPTPPPELLDLLAAYHFPGNIRELEAMVFDAVSRHSSGILPLTAFEDQIITGSGPAAGKSGGEKPEIRAAMSFPDRLPSIRENTQLLIDEALRRSNGNISVASGMLGISHQALRKRLRGIKQ